MKMLAPPSLRSMRGLPCCMVRITSAPSMRSYHWAVASGLAVRKWMWSQVYAAMVRSPSSIRWLFDGRRLLFAALRRDDTDAKPGEDFLVVLAKRGRGRVDARPAMGKGERRERHAETALQSRGSGMAVDDAAGRKLRVGQRLAHGAHARGRDVARLQELLPFIRRARQHDLRKHGDLAIMVGIALVVAALDHVRAPDHRPQPALLAQIAGPQHDEPVLGLEGPVRRMGMAVAVRLGMNAVAQISRQMRANEDHSHIEHGHVDALAASGALALEQGRGQGEGAGHPGRVVDRRRAEFDRVNVLGPSHRHDAG